MQQLELFNNSIIPYIGNYMTIKTQLKKLIIEKFRALKNLEVEFGDAITVICGKMVHRSLQF